MEESEENRLLMNGPGLFPKDLLVYLETGNRSVEQMKNSVGMHYPNVDFNRGPSSVAGVSAQMFTMPAGLGPWFYGK